MTQEKGLKILGADKTFFGKLTNTITRLLIPTKVGINGLLIHAKRNNLLKAYENYTEDSSEDATKKEELLKKYEDMFGLYLESIDKYVMDSIYKKVKNDTATNFEKEALSKYYTVIHLKETQYLEYKYRKQKYLLELDYETVLTQNKDKVIIRYQKFYASKMETLYKGILKNYSIRLSDHGTEQEKRNEIYESIFSTLEEYISEILPIKMEDTDQTTDKEVVEQYDKFNTFLAGKLDQKDMIEKKVVLLGISRKLFTHSLPLIVAEQCYIKLLKDTRQLVVTSKNTKKQQEIYAMLMHLIEDYNIKLLSTKIYWDKPAQREEYKKFWDAYNMVQKLKLAEEEKVKQKEILFIKNDIKALEKKKEKYANMIQFYRTKLVEYGMMKNRKNRCKTITGKFAKKKMVVA